MDSRNPKILFIVVLSFEQRVHVVLWPKGVYLAFLRIGPMLGETMVGRGHVVGPLMVLDLCPKCGLSSPWIVRHNLWAIEDSFLDSPEQL